VTKSTLPVVAPNYRYGFFGRPDAWGGRTSVDVSAFNVMRDIGTSDQQAQLSATWERPFLGALGDQWKTSVHLAALGSTATSLNQTPSWSTNGSAQAATALPQAAIELRWPWARGDAATGRQLIEPIVQVIAAPIIGVNTFAKVPNEDSLDLQFTDANLFAWNRFPGLDRMEGGTRANVGLHGAWYFPGGTTLDGLIGQSYRLHEDNIFPIGSGLDKKVSDFVGRVSVIPSKYLDFTVRGRFRSDDFAPQYGEAVTGFGLPVLRFNVGYVYDVTNPYNLYDTPPGATVPVSILAPTPRNEGLAGVSTSFGHWRASGYARRDLASNQMVAVGASGAYEDECLIFSVSYYKRYTSLDGDSGSQTVLFQVTFKTVGQLGFHAF
jgi:LPS-assembly protein